jgi:hypothetical protein
MRRVRRRRPTHHRGRRIVGTVVIAAAALAACRSPVKPPDDATAERASRAPATAAVALANSAAPLPRSDLSLSDRARWRSILTWSDDCETAFQSSHAGADPGLVFHELAPRLAVVEVLCAAGSYQPSSTFVRFDERGPAPAAAILRFPVYEAENGATVTAAESVEVWGEISIDSATPVMTVLNLARQTGDCGVWTRYDIAGETPAVTDARARLPCPARPRPSIRFDPRHPPLGWRRITTIR